MEEKNQIDYFKCRDVQLSDEVQYTTPRFLIPYLPINKDSFILEIGTGPGYFIGDCVKNHDRTNVKGVDISKESVDFCQLNGLPVQHIENLDTYIEEEQQQYDFIYMSHVLEHLPKTEIIPILSKLRKKLLKQGGCIFIVVPNAQSSTGAYWAFEDFTHRTLFTTGSLKYVLCGAGFNNIKFVDLDGFASMSKKELRWRKALLRCYKKLKQLEMFITRSFYHEKSPISYCWEIKAVGYNKE